jgi:cell division ATPase FtsA
MEEIIEHIYYEIKNSGYEKKLIGGIVLTGGGALLKHLSQLTEFMTGMDTRIGYPNEHLAPETQDEMASPMYATGIGLVIQGIERYLRENVREKHAKQKVDDLKRHDQPLEAMQQETTEDEPEFENAAEEDIRKRPKSNGFLKRIQDWFEGDEV